MSATGAPRVLQVALSLNPGGTERLIVDLATRLHAEMPTAVCCLDERGAWAADLERQGICVAALGRRPGFHPSLGVALARVAREHRADVLHAHHYSPFVYSALARVRSPRLRVVFTEHGRLSDRGPSAKRRLANRALRFGASAVFAVSEDVKRHLVGEGFSDRDVGVIYNGIDVGPLPTPAARARVRQALGAADNVCVIGTIARLDPVKDLSTLVDAVALVSRDRPTHLVIVGDGSERAALEARVRDEPGLGSMVAFLGQRGDARDWLAGCDLYANSSISEGVSLTILEAMAAGLPIVATAVGGTPEVIDASCGVLTPPRDVAALAQAMSRLARQPDARADLGRKARRRVETRFDLGRMIGEYRQTYLSVTGGV